MELEIEYHVSVLRMGHSTMAWLGHLSQSHLVTNEPRLGFNNSHSRGQDKALQDMFMPT